MDGRLMIEDGTILDLLELVTGSNRWEDGGTRPQARSARASSSSCKALFRRNEPAQGAAQRRPSLRPRRRALRDSSSTTTASIAALISPIPANSLEQAQADKKAHIAAKLDLKAGQRVLDIGCGWGGTALYLHRVAEVDVLGITLSEEQLKVARRRAEEAGVADHVRFELIDYRDARRAVRPDRLGRHVRACRPRPLRRILRQVPRPAEARRGDAAPHHRQARHVAGAPDPFTDKYIFPGYHLPSLVADRRGEREGAADRQRRRDAAAALCLYAARTGSSA